MPEPTGTDSTRSPPDGRRPIMPLLDLLGRRWALRILWELRDGPLTSRALREACDDVSPSVLQARIDELRAAGIVELRPNTGYALTAAGQRLGTVLLALNAWAREWARNEDMPPGTKKGGP